MARRFDLGSLRLCVSAAEPLPAPTYEEWVATTGRECLDGIGSTEMFHIFVSSLPGRVRPGATGMPVPGYDCRVLDEEGREVPRGTPGLIAIKGPTGCKYWRKPDRQAEYVRFGGWNVTGDVYVHDDDGYFTYQCRSDDMIVTGGYKIPGPEVEHVLDEHPAVAESAVVAMPDSTRGFVPKAFVVLRPAGRQRRAGQGAPGPREEGARALQVSPPGRVRAHLASHGDGQDPPGGAPPAGGRARRRALNPLMRQSRTRGSRRGSPGSEPALHRSVMIGQKVIGAIVATLIGLLVAYLMWGTQTKSLRGELDQLKARLAEAQKATTREKELSDKLAQLEAQLKQVSDDLAEETARREEMQAQVSTGLK